MTTLKALEDICRRCEKQHHIAHKVCPYKLTNVKCDEYLEIEYALDNYEKLKKCGVGK